MLRTIYDRSGLTPTPSATLTGSTAYFSMCDYQHEQFSAQRERHPARPVELFAEASREHVIAWLYPDCGSPPGLVRRGDSQPCSSMQTARVT